MSSARRDREIHHSMPVETLGCGAAGPAHRPTGVPYPFGDGCIFSCLSGISFIPDGCAVRRMPFWTCKGRPMKMLLSYMTIILTATLIWGCAAPQKPAVSNEDTAFYLARFDEVWDATLAALRTESIAVESMNKDRGVIATKFVSFSSGPQAHYEIGEIAEPPSDVRLALWSQVGYTLSILITPISDMSTRVKVIAHVEAYDKNATQEWHGCASNKSIESKFIEKIRAHL